MRRTPSVLATRGVPYDGRSPCQKRQSSFTSAIHTHRRRLTSPRTRTYRRRGAAGVERATEVDRPRSAFPVPVDEAQVRHLDRSSSASAQSARIRAGARRRAPRSFLLLAATTGS